MHYNYIGVKFDEHYILETILKHVLMLLLELLVELYPSVNNTLMWDIGLIHIFICLILL